MKQLAFILLYCMSFSAQAQDIGFVEIPTQKSSTVDTETITEHTKALAAQSLFSISPTRIYNFAQVTFTTPEAGKVTIAIHDLGGEQVKIITSDTLQKGKYKKTLQLKDMDNGVYHVVLKMKDYTEMRKIIVSK